MDHTASDVTTGRGGAWLLQIGLDVNSRLFRNVLEGVSDEDFVARLNDRTNSMQWIAGHIVHLRAQMARLVDAPIDNPGMSPFHDPIDPSADYPDRQEIIVVWEAASKALLDRLPRLTGAELRLPAHMHLPVSEPTIAGALAFFAEHEGYHLGQLGFLRKALGYAAVQYS